MSLERLVCRFCLFVAGFTAVSFVAFGQQTQNDQKAPTFSKDVKVVNVLATVRDKHGKIVNGLSQDDFVLEEDGRPQSVRYFSRETDLPLTLGLLVDTSVSQRKALDQERNASGTFVGEVLRKDKDSAFLIHFDREVELLQDVTKSPQKVGDALKELQVAQRDEEERQRGSQDDSGGYPGGGRGGRHGGQSDGARRRAGTLLYDSVFLASDELMDKQEGRKAVIVMSDGVDRGSKTSLDGAIESAQRANTVVYAIYFAGEESGAGPGRWGHGSMSGPWGRPGGGGGYPGGGYPGGGYPGGAGRRPEEPRVDGKKILDRIAKETGGRMFEVTKKQTVEQIYQQIQDDLRNQYNLGYTPDRNADETRDYHKIQLATKDKDLVVQARDGYYSDVQLDSTKKGQ